MLLLTAIQRSWFDEMSVIASVTLSNSNSREGINLRISEWILEGLKSSGGRG
ncbi:unnamed protein product [Meloidogyne enterolobii]|uniref:Uncharacterized protein n=1 Tax=Meloidogyne enterolobii TaxID=390850 RepID=A0ACB0YZ89_MELEN